jgi:hypothetical protein
MVLLVDTFILRANCFETSETYPSGESVVSKIDVQFEGCMGLTVGQVAALAHEIYRDAKPSIK